MTHHVIMMSGGAGSFAAAKRVLAGKPNHVTLLFCDTLIEDEDLYRFLDDIEDHLGIPITRIARPMSMAKFRRRVETKKFVEGMEWGGCGCFSDD